jgi:hypothetical protein
MTKRPYPRWERRHEAVLHWLIEHPTATLREGALALRGILARIFRGLRTRLTSNGTCWSSAPSLNAKCYLA